MTKRKPRIARTTPDAIDMRNPEINFKDGERTLVTIHQLAEKLNIVPRTISRYVDQGILPQPIRFGSRCVRYDLEATMAAARAYIENCVAESEE